MSKPPSLNPSSLPFFPSLPPSSLPETPRTTTNTAHRLSGSSAASFRSSRGDMEDEPVRSVRSSPSTFARQSVGVGAIGDGREHFSAPTSDHPLGLGVPAPNGNGRPKFTSNLSDTNTSLSASPPLPHPQETFDALLRSSPLMSDILDRLTRTEHHTLSIQRDLGDISRKLSVLLSSPPQSNAGQQEDVKQLAQRVNTLTTSVSQLLALQTKAHLQSVNASFTPSVSPAPLPPQPPVPSVAPQSPAAFRDPRPSPRPTGSPLRQWSQGPLDFSHLPRDPGLVRQEAIVRATPGGIGSVGVVGGLVNGGGERKRPTAGMIRRESANSVIDSEWGGGSPREAGPNVTKWDQLPLSLELQHAIVKYGVGPPNKIQQRAVPFLLRGSDIIAQAPPTQERIAAYVIPAIQLTLNALSSRPATLPPPRGPIVLLISTTVDQANQGHKMLRDLGGPIGLRVALCAGGGADVQGELRAFAQGGMPHVLCGTPQRVNALFTSPGGLSGAEVRFVVLDEVDQLIARNLHEYVFSLVRLLPAARRAAGGATGGLASGGTPAVSPAAPMTPIHNPFDGPFPTSPFQPSTGTGTGSNNGINRRFAPVLPSPGLEALPGVERQTALFSNTVPQDVLNLANAIQMREAVRVLVRRDGGGGPGPGAGSGSMGNGLAASHPETPGGAGHAMRGLRNYYLYLAFTAGGRSEPAPQTPGGGLGIIGSGRANANGGMSAETEMARGWKLDALSEVLEDVEAGAGAGMGVIVYVGGMVALEAVSFKLAGRGLEVVAVHGDMNPGVRMAAFAKFRSGTGGANGQRQQGGQQGSMKVLVAYDVHVKPPDVFQVPLVVNYDLPKAVEEYAHRVAPAISNPHSRPGVIVNFVTATGGDVEMLRSIECFYKIKCPEVPSSLRDVL